ncbi:hypothetical protein [Egicoccus sp. AB-alg2]|uniref:hypothetical protein n=1 Tax=Egicoccus sp. AB-alg2 TaxID=3242693 RepID=UPI00359D70C5
MPPIRDDDPLFEPLPPLEPADDGGLPAHEQLEYLELVAAALATEAQLLATGEVDHELLRQTHDGIAFDKVAARVEELAAHGVIERLPDLRYTSIHVRHAGGSHYAIVRSCFEPGPRTGLYDADTREMVAPMGESSFGDERMVWRVPEQGSEEASLRVMDVQGVPPDDCD